MYSMWKIMCFLNLKPHKHIALHQIHKIMFFLAMSFDPFKEYFIQVFYVSPHHCQSVMSMLAARQYSL